ncbi:MAG: hypothetical protein ACYC35_03030 [Pirellulales bacterium]|jgi:hypothetical protein
MTDFETDTLLALVHEKHECLIQLGDLGRRQLDLIDGGDMAQLLRLLSVKQQLLTTLQRIERALDPFRGQAPHERRWRAEADRGRCAGLLARCEALLSEIVAQEKESETRLRLRRDEAAQRLQGAHTAGQARGAYTLEAESSSRQIDLLTQ